MDGCQYLGRGHKTGSLVTWEQETPTYKQTGRKSNWKWETLAVLDKACLGWGTSNSSIQAKYELYLKKYKKEKEKHAIQN